MHPRLADPFRRFLKRAIPTRLLARLRPETKGRIKHFLGVGPRVERIRDLARLDAKIEECVAASKISDDALRREFNTFYMDPPPCAGRDPDSEEYRRAQFAHYERLAGKPYATSNEMNNFDEAGAARSPFPFGGSCTTTGDHLMALGFTLKCMDLAPGSRVLEFGPGWGNAADSLARMGHRVTAVDISPRHIEMIRERARRIGVEIETIVDDFSYIEKVSEPYDAVLFIACFHHASDHQRLVRGFERALKPGGIVVLAGEPVTRDFPVPWGLRLDGESLWAIRHHGWLELGFRESYFRGLLARHGWSLTQHVPHDTPWGMVFIARRRG